MERIYISKEKDKELREKYGAKSKDELIELLLEAEEDAIDARYEHMESVERASM